MKISTGMSLNSAGLVLVLFACWSLLAQQMHGFADDPGLGWHLETGRLILEQGVIPRVDPFLAGAPARSWVADQWLADVILYSLYHLGSWPLLYGASIAIFLISYFCLLFPLALRKTGTLFGAIVATLIAFKLGQIHFLARPLIFNFPLFCYLLKNLSKLEDASRDNSTALQWPKLYFFLPLSFAFWANIHGSFALGLILLGLLTTIKIAAKLFDKQASSDPYFPWRLATLTALSTAATLLNPYGYTIHRNIFNYTQSEYFMHLMAEWLPLSFSSFEGQVFTAVSLLLTGYFIVFRFSALKLGVFYPIALTVLGVLTVRSLRILPFWGLLSTIPVAAALGELARYLGQTDRLHFAKALWISGTEKCHNNSAAFIRNGVLIFSTAIVIGAGVFKTVFFVREPLGPNPERFPYQAINFLINSHKTAVIASHPDWGGFITLYGQGKLKALIDDRNRMLGENFYRQYFKSLDLAQSWQEYLNSLQATHLLLSPAEPFCQAILERGTLLPVYQDDVAILFEVPKS